jgi:GTP pyrophosphokinase
MTLAQQGIDPSLAAACLETVDTFLKAAPPDSLPTPLPLLSDQHIALICPLNPDVTMLSALVTLPWTQTLPLKSLTYPDTLTPLVSLLTKAQKIQRTIDTINLQARKQSQQNLKHILLATITDPSALIICLVHVIAALETDKKHPTEALCQSAKTARSVYIPLAQCFGLGDLKWQLEDVTCYIAHPAEYQAIKAALNTKRADRESHVQRVIARLSAQIKEHVTPDFALTGRVKHIDSIYRKMQKKQIDFSALYDTTACRILLDSTTTCYGVLSLIQSEFDTIAPEFNDYIAKPKPNGYQSIHAVILFEAQRVEIQIRTHAMHQAAEFGQAAHWHYKETGGSQGTSSVHTKVNQLLQLRSLAAKDTLYHSLFDDQVYVFTPEGAVVGLPQGATAIDFAYHLHTQLGHRCKGALVEGQIKPLRYPLNTGEVVQILTHKTDQPSPDWLNPEAGYVQTNKARRKIQHFLRQKNQAAQIKLGESLWEKHAKPLGLTYDDLKRAYSRFNIHKQADMMIAFASNTLGVHTVIHYLQSIDSDDSEKTQGADLSHAMSTPDHPSEQTVIQSSDLIIEEVDNLLTSTAQCCQAIPGDAIAAYISRAKGLVIHQQACPNLKRSQALHPERVLSASWHRQTQGHYQTTLLLTTKQTPKDNLETLLLKNKVHVLKRQVYPGKLDNTCFVKLTLRLNNTACLSQIMQAIQHLPEVQQIKRY